MIRIVRYFSSTQNWNSFGPPATTDQAVAKILAFLIFGHFGRKLRIRSEHQKILQGAFLRHFYAKI